MIRQRVNVRRGWATPAGQLLVVAALVPVAWAALVVLLLSVGLDAGSQDTGLLGHRAVLDALDLDADWATSWARWAGGAGAIVAGALCLRLAAAQVPRPELARTELEVHRDERGAVLVAPRAAERVVEIAAGDVHGVGGARARLDGDDVVVALQITASALPVAVARAHTAGLAALRRHGLEDLGVRVVAAKVDVKNRRELA